MRMTVLGGSSPFTIGLFAALGERPCQPINQIMLFGRDRTVMESVARFGASRLREVNVAWTTDADEACSDFDVVLHQIRYGGLEGRADDEAVAFEAGSIADETIGPGAFNAAMRLHGPFAAMAKRVAALSPNAHFINLTNPLGLSTSLAKTAGIKNPIGVCELPKVTAVEAATAIGVAPNALAWSYAGLNHRGFLHNLSVGGEDVLPAIVASAKKGFGGLVGTDLLTLQGLPTKYFSIFTNRLAVSAPGRAKALSALRLVVAAELAQNPTLLPPSLAARDQPWWSEAVVPLLHALTGARSERQILNLVGEDGVTREGWCSVDRRGVEWLKQIEPPTPIAAWVEKFEKHESASLEALLDPTASYSFAARGCVH